MSSSLPTLRPSGADWQQQTSTDLTAERAAWEQAEATRRQELLDEHRAEHDALEQALKAATAQRDQLSADLEAERADWQQQLATGKAHEGTVVDQLSAERDKLEAALKAANAQREQLSADHDAKRADWQQQTSTDLTAERAAWEQAEATHRQELVNEHRSEHDALEQALNEANAKRDQLSADLEAERADWQQQLATGRAQEGTVVEQLSAERDKLEAALKAANAQREQLSADHDAKRADWQQQTSTDLTAERAAWEQAETTRRQELVDEHRAEHDALEYALNAANARRQQLSADREAERAEWQQQLAAVTAREATVVEQLSAERDKKERALNAADAQQPLSTDVASEQGTWEQTEAQRATRTMDLNAAIGQLDPVLRGLVGEDIEFAVGPTSKLDPVEVNPDHVEELLIGLAVVAREAMPAGGIVRLGTSSVEIDDAHGRQYPGVPPGQYARLTLRASGWGMDPQVQDRASSAVASDGDSEVAKELGLASVLRAFRQTGGHIAVEAEPDRNLVFTGYLPTVGSRSAVNVPHRTETGDASG